MTTKMKIESLKSEKKKNPMDSQSISKANEYLNFSMKNGALSVREMISSGAKAKHIRAKSTHTKARASEHNDRRSIHSNLSSTQLKDANFISQGIEYFEFKEGNDTLITETNEITDICRDIEEIRETCKNLEASTELSNGKYQKLAFFHKLLVKEIRSLKEKTENQERVLKLL